MCVINKWKIPICVTFTCNWLDWTGLGLGLGLVVFGLGLITDFWSRSRSRSRSCTLWSRSWPRSHYVLVSLTSLLTTAVGNPQLPDNSTTVFTCKEVHFRGTFTSLLFLILFNVTATLLLSTRDDAIGLLLRVTSNWSVMIFASYSLVSTAPAALHYKPATAPPPMPQLCGTAWSSRWLMIQLTNGQHTCEVVSK